MQPKPKGLHFILPDGVKDKDVSVIEVGPFFEDKLAEEYNAFLGTRIEKLTRVNSYLLVHPKGLYGLETLLQGKPFVDPIIHQASLNEPLIPRLGILYDYVLQSMLNPGTSDAKGDIALGQALLFLGEGFQEGDQGFFSPQYFVKGDLSKDQLEDVSAELANPALHTRLILSKKDYQGGWGVKVPIVTLPPRVRVKKYAVVNFSDKQLLKLNSKRKLAASLEELRQFRDVYKDVYFVQKRRGHGLTNQATDVEIETWFGLRSEHCFHKEFNAVITLDDKVGDPVFKRAFDKGYFTKGQDGNYILSGGLFNTFIRDPAFRINQKLEKRGKNWIVSMFDDNSGVVLYDEDFMYCIKFETHNSPSNKEPVQGAKTGINGVNRDIFGTMLGNFEAIANFFYYCTGNPDYKGWLPGGVKHPLTLLKGVTRGVREGGNESQIPTLGGGLITDSRYIAKCLVFAGTVGWSPVRTADYYHRFDSVSPSVGDFVYVAGQPVGIDGIHGATESSLSASADISLGHVQADFSFTQVKVKDYLLEVARNMLLTDCTDFGAVGLASSSHEMARKTGGLEMDLSLHPVKYDGIQPFQINCSETQDRMLLVSSPEKKKELLDRAKLHDVRVTQLGELTDSGYIHLTCGDETVALMDIKKLFDKEPRKGMRATYLSGEDLEGVGLSIFRNIVNHLG